MPKNKKSLGFRMSDETDNTPVEKWDIYPNHLYIPEDYWTMSTSADEFNKKIKKTKKKSQK